MRDELTSLPGRAAFFKNGRNMLRFSDSSNRVALHIIHIANLKAVIMEYGLHIGEAVLKVAGQRLYGTFQEDKMFARLEGDMFGLLYQGVIHDGYAIYTARRVLENLRDPVMFNGLEIPIEVRTGIAFCPDHGTEMEAVYEYAIEALLSSGGSKDLKELKKS